MLYTSQSSSSNLRSTFRGDQSCNPAAKFLQGRGENSLRHEGKADPEPPGRYGVLGIARRDDDAQFGAQAVIEQRLRSKELRRGHPRPAPVDCLRLVRSTLRPEFGAQDEREEGAEVDPDEHAVVRAEVREAEFVQGLHRDVAAAGEAPAVRVQVRR